jgi:hypothetical protein
VTINVADQGCLSWILDPDFYPFRNKIGGGKIVVLPLFVATNITEFKE